MGTLFESLIDLGENKAYDCQIWAESWYESRTKAGEPLGIRVIGVITITDTKYIIEVVAKNVFGKVLEDFSYKKEVLLEEKASLLLDCIPSTLLNCDWKGI